jgi:hypothetical protein
VAIYLVLVEFTKRALLTPQDLLATVPPARPTARRVHRRAARFSTPHGN